jgi:hypothetical protein
MRRSIHEEGPRMSGHGHDDGHDDGHGHSAPVPEVPSEPRPVLQGVGLVLCLLATVALAVFVQG